MNTLFKTLFFLLSVLGVIIMQSCEEIGPPIDFSQQKPPDTSGNNNSTGFDSVRVVLLEDFTGIKCVNCPKGHDKLHELELAYPDKVIGMSIHAGFFANSYLGQQEFKVQEGIDIDGMIGPATGWPSAGIDRRTFTGQSKIIVFPETIWTGYVEQELDSLPKVLINIDHEYDDTNGDIDVDVHLVFLESFTTPPYLSIAILEDGIIDLQDTPDGLDSFYVHNNVLRDMITSYNGRLISQNITIDGTITESFSTFTLPSNVNDDNAKLLVFVHDVGISFYVYQAAVKALKE
ncbi:MAG: Omp28-related outer membrane protein [Bacteroidetes bacterium]|nr:Omp28-related outer membrane protein [Bacteroidota bacterium]